MLNTVLFGFDRKVNKELKKYFNVKLHISNYEGSDISWDEINSCSFNVDNYDMDDTLLTSLKYSYYKYSDMISRKYVYRNKFQSYLHNEFFIYSSIAYNMLRNLNIELVIFQNIPHEGFDYILYLICKNKKIKTIMMNQSLFPSKFWIFKDIDDYGKFTKFKKQNDKPDKKIIRLPDEWFWMKPKNNIKLIVNIESIKKNILNTFLIKKIKYKFIKEKDLNQNFVYVPLQLQPELTTVSQSGKDELYADQAYMLEKLRKIVPNDIYIIIKENPKQSHLYRDELFYKRVSKLINTKFIAPNTDTYTLIKNSKFIATVSGTVGYECIFYNKNVIVFGNTWYQELSHVIKIEDLMDENDLLRQLKSKENVFECKMKLHEELLKILEHSCNGVIDEDYIKMLKDFDEDKNSKVVADEINKFFTKNY